MRKIIALIMLGFTTAAVPALAADVPGYTLIPEKSFLKFYAIQNGAPVEGKFTGFFADIRFDPEQLDKSTIKVEVSVDSLITANADVGKNLRLPEWLSVDAFPKAIYVSKKISRMPMTDNYYADGELTLRGKTLPAVLNFQFEHMDNSRAIAAGFVTLHRKDFGVGQGEWSRDDVVKDEVRVEFRIAADKR